MSCWSCTHYRAGGDGFIAAYCEIDKTGFPFLGDNCPKFEYEPGSDEIAESADKERHEYWKENG